MGAFYLVMEKLTLGKINLYNCDCVEYMRTLPDKYYSLAIKYDFVIASVKY